jgi:hypothetical protein
MRALFKFRAIFKGCGNDPRLIIAHFGVAFSKVLVKIGVKSASRLSNFCAISKGSGSNPGLFLAYFRVAVSKILVD